MDTVVSGIRSTGNLHLGNYFGMIQNSLKMQHEHKSFFFIADYHSLTTHPTPADLHSNVRQVLAEYLAAGIDPEAATLYVQSDVPEIAELYLLLNMNSYLGELERTTSFKDKVRSQPENVNAGLLTYPVLMAADILIHKAAKVPVGKDQEQNLEMARKFARRFNQMYNTDCFPEPNMFVFSGKPIKVPGLDGTGKMGKSEGNGIYLADDDKTIRKKVMRAVTDAGPKEPNSPIPEPIQSIFCLMELVSSPADIEQFRLAYADCSIRYGDLKKQLADDICKFVAPIREKISSISCDTEYLRKVSKNGAEKARESAQKTLAEVRSIIGFRQF
jgi:tryptophanyl-tRNA synthetase